MITRPLGPSQIEASAIGFGAWAIGGWMWGGASSEDAVRAIHAAIDAGVTLIDTAPIYGFGVSEEVVGRAIKDRRDQVVLATKCGMIVGSSRGEPKFRSTGAAVSEHGHLDVRIYNGPDSIREEVDRSLARLGTDRIDLYQTHWQDTTTPLEETVDCLMELKREGKIRAIGACNATADHLRVYADRGQLDSDQEKYSMIDRGIEQDQLPLCRERGAAVLAYSPLSRGLLTGKIGPEKEFGKGDFRAQMPRFSVENRQRVAAMLDKLRPFAEEAGLSLAQLVIAWTIAQPGVTHVLCGARNPEQALENAAAGREPLPDGIVTRVNDVVAATADIV